MSTALATKINSLAPASDLKTLADLFSQRRNSLRQAAASFIDPDRIAKIAIRCVQMTPALRECSCESVFRAVLQAAEMGLEPGSALGEAYLVPFKQQCQLIVGYRGLIALAFRSGHVKTVRSMVVYDGDAFNYSDGLSLTLEHTPCGEVSPAKITHAYCIIELKDGGVLPTVMTRAEIDAIRGRSRAGSSGPWVTDYAEMAKKTVARRGLKYAPMSIEMSRALAADAHADTGKDVFLAEFETFDELVDVEQPEPTRGAKAVHEKVKAKNGEAEPQSEASGPPYTGPTVRDDEEQGTLE